MVLVPNASKGIFRKDFSSCVVGQIGWGLGRVQIPVSPGLRSVLAWVLQGCCFLASYLNPPQMEMVGGHGPGTHSKEEVRAGCEKCVPF